MYMEAKYFHLRGEGGIEKLTEVDAPSWVEAKRLTSTTPNIVTVSLGQLNNSL